MQIVHASNFPLVRLFRSDRIEHELGIWDAQRELDTMGPGFVTHLTGGWACSAVTSITLLGDADYVRFPQNRNTRFV